MKGAGSLILTIVFGIVAIWLVFKLLVGALKLVGILIVIGIAAGGYLVARRMIEGQGKS
ncbi:MAG TPA: hypothetical protein VK472_06415 [Allosphingosinicella sp.]|nr:hypothetical protein [Allosphingosinicella sp.]